MDEKIEEIEDIIYYLDELIDKIKFDKDLKTDLQQMKYAKEDELEELLSMRNALDIKEAEISMLNTMLDNSISKAKIKEKMNKIRKYNPYECIETDKCIEAFYKELLEDK